MKTCQVCKKEYYPHSDDETKYDYCSEACRGKIYTDIERTRQIRRGDYRNMSIKTIERLGFIVEVYEK